MSVRTNVLPASFLFIFFTFFFAQAQSKPNYCDPTIETVAVMKQVSETYDAGLSRREAYQRRLSLTQDLVKRHPEDYFAQRDYMEERMDIDRSPLLAEYKTRIEQTPDSPIFNYLYSFLLVGRNTKEAMQRLEGIARRSPEFPWAYSALARIYQTPVFRDPEKFRENMKKWITLCPSSPSYYQTLLDSNDAELMREGAKRLRQRLASVTDPDECESYETLWAMEFKVTPVVEHPTLRRKIADDVKRLHQMNVEPTKTLLKTLIAGYKLTEDKDERQKAEDLLLTLFPNSTLAKRIVRNRWKSENPMPGQDQSSEKKNAYSEKLLKATDGWLKQWPDDEDVWSMRLDAVNALENLPIAEVEKTADGFLKAHKKNEGFHLPPRSIAIANLYLKRNIRLELVPQLIQEADESMAKLEKDVRLNTNDTYEREAGDAANMNWARWIAWPVLAEVYAKLNQPEKARAILRQMAVMLNTDKPDEQAKQEQKTSYSSNQIAYWQLTGKIAEIESRKLDALTAYQTALSFRPKQPATVGGEKKDELADNAKRLWKDLGGTGDGWQSYLARNHVAKSVTEAAGSTWETKNQVLPDFALTDMEGKLWKLADLKGKTAFINLWATWCGPCIQELPYVQKLHEQMKDRKDVLVLTLNIDAELGLVEPFMKDKKYSFTVIPAQAYAESLNVFSIPRNWVVSVDGVLQLEGIGYGGEGEEWIKKAAGMIEKVKAGADGKK